MNHYTHYFWKDGIPVGNSKIDPSKAKNSYKIVSDPYKKRISIEKYHFLNFDKIIYDSALINFRDLKKPELMAWQKSIEKDLQGENKGFIRNQDDRLVFIETYRFDGDLCRECRITSPHGLFLSLHKMSYSHLGDPFDGVTLYDANDIPVMQKRYEFDKNTQQFTELLEERWDLKNHV